MVAVLFFVCAVALLLSPLDAFILVLPYADGGEGAFDVTRVPCHVDAINGIEGTDGCCCPACCALTCRPAV